MTDPVSASDAIKAAETFIGAIRPFTDPIMAESGRIVSNTLAFLIGDRVAAKRAKTAGETIAASQDILTKRGVETPREIPLSLAVPLLEGAMDETRDGLKEWWALLIANAKDPNRPMNLRLETIETLKAIHPLDAYILSQALAYKPSEHPQWPYRCGDLVNATQDEVHVSLDWLSKRGLLMAHNGMWVINPVGRELLRAVEK